MNHSGGIDPLDALRDADPAAHDRLPSASLARVRARVQEEIMTDTDVRRVRARGNRGLALGGAGAALAVLALVVFAAPGVVRPGAPAPADLAPASTTAAATAATRANPPASSVPASHAPGQQPPGVPGGMASCVESYSLDSLRHRGFAFDGTVTSIAGDEVTFRVTTHFRGSGDRVSLTATGMTGTSISSAGGPNLALGSRYLVAGDDHFVWPCGFTQEYDPAVAAQWATALS